MHTIKRRKYFHVVVLLLTGVLLGWWLKPNPATKDTLKAEDSQARASTWTCSMHPQVRQPEPGKCPLCGMDLIPAVSVSSHANEVLPDALELSPAAAALASVETMRIGSSTTTKRTLLLNGKVEVNEEKIFMQVAHIAGRIEQLFIYKGQYVRKGQLIAYIYSPELLTTQEELRQAMQRADQQPALLESVQQKLRNWKLTNEQIQSLTQQEQPLRQLPLYAERTGYVMSRSVSTGDYVSVGQPIYELADLSSVWVWLDVYETDLAWVKPGSKLQLSLPVLEGKQLSATIDYIEPFIDPQSRVARARAVLSNTAGWLKPGMWVRASLEIDLHTQHKSPLILPRTAVIWTGKRSIVYVQHYHQGKPHYEMREVMLVGATDEGYLIEQGLEPGEEVVVYGTFLIDAEAQLSDKPSMMNRRALSFVPKTLALADEQSLGLLTAAHKKSLQLLLEVYLKLKGALSADNTQEAIIYAHHAAKALVQLSHKQPDSPFANWESDIQWLNQQLLQSTDIEALRQLFVRFSELVLQWVRQTKLQQQTLYVQYCPMANNDKGAYWLSNTQVIENPYFGSAMLRCGTVEDILKADSRP